MTNFSRTLMARLRTLPFQQQQGHPQESFLGSTLLHQCGNRPLTERMGIPEAAGKRPLALQFRICKGSLKLLIIYLNCGDQRSQNLVYTLYLNVLMPQHTLRGLMKSIPTGLKQFWQPKGWCTQH